MNEPIPYPSLHLLAALLGPGAATFMAWWLFLGFDSDDVYTIPQCAGLVLALVAIGVAASWLSRSNERGVVILSASVGISAGCFTSWMDDDTGLFLIGWVMLTLFAFLGVALVVQLTEAAKNSLSGDQRSTR